MTRAEFVWDEQNVDHIARHGVEPDEAEAVLDNGPLVLRTADGRYAAYGQSDEGATCWWCSSGPQQTASV